MTINPVVALDGVDLDDMTRCELAERCATCGSDQELELAILETMVGVYCVTLCLDDIAAGNLSPRRSWAQLFELVGKHCQHLGIDLDQMAAAMERGKD